MIESNCRKIILIEKSDCLYGFDQIVGNLNNLDLNKL